MKKPRHISQGTAWIVILLLCTLLQSFTRIGHRHGARPTPLVEALLHPTILWKADSLTRAGADSLALTDSLAIADSLALMGADSLAFADSLAIADSLILSARDAYVKQLLDSLHLPLSDSIRIPARDSMGLIIRDTLGFFYVLDSLGMIQLDSTGVFMVDSTATFTPKEIKYLRRLKKRQLKAEADSIRRSTFRVWETFAVHEDSLRFQRTVQWYNDPYFNEVHFALLDTNINDRYNDYAHLRMDGNASYLGVSGSPVLLDNYFKRPQQERFSFWDAGMTEAYTRETLPFYNTKTAYTLMAYTGTLFANKQNEESNVRFLHTQNITPESNVQFYYQRMGGKGLLQNESTNTRTLAVNGNYLGKRYALHAGYIMNKLERQENGGISDDSFILDTLIEARAVPIVLSEANSLLKSHTLFVTQSLGVPLRISKKDTLAAGSGTMVYFGHSGEWNTFYRTYNDRINAVDYTARDFYHNAFYFNPTTTADSVRTTRIDNRLFIRLQPFSDTSIVSKLEGGVGYEFLRNYNFQPEQYLRGPISVNQNNLYAYAGASGQLSRYFSWHALGRLDFAGYYAGDMMLDANVRFSAFPLPEGIHLDGRFFFKNYTPDYYTQHYYSNHYIWDNSFSKTTDTRIEATFSVPKWKLKASFSYGLLNNGTYYDTLGVVRQASEVVSLMAFSLYKDFTLGWFHFDHRATVQLSSNKELFPLPLVSGDIRYYVEIPVVRNVMSLQLGAHALFHTAYYMPAYSPALGVFHLQNEAQYGNTPYIDAFVNMKWKRATIFAKYMNVAMGWPNSDYFSAPHYIRPQRVIKLGMSWPFPLKPASGKNASGSGSSGSSDSGSGIGSGRMSTGRSGGLSGAREFSP